MILINARILTCDAVNRVIDSGSVEVRPDGAIGVVRAGRMRGGDMVDAGGRLLMPALINCHSHLYSALARGMPASAPPPRNFTEILQKVWWRLDRALNEEDVYYSALTGLIDSALCGVGTVVDHHSSPNACAGSLDQVARAFRKVGLRGATCFEISDRNGPRAAKAAVRENVRFIERARPGALVGAAFGLHAAFTLGDRTLRTCLEANQTLDAPFHIHVAEDRCDRGAVRRLCALGILDERALAAHCVHVTAGERALLARRGVNVIHNPQSNCNNAVGAADVFAFARRGVLVGLGSDGYSPRLWDEVRTALHVQPPRARSAVLQLPLNNRTIVKKLWDLDLGRIETGAKADLVLVDYFPPAPMDASNLSGHLVFGIANAPVDSLMVDGRWVVRGRRCVNVDERRIARKAAARAKSLWERM